MRDILFWTTEAGSAIFWAAIVVGVIGLVHQGVVSAWRWLFPRGGIRA